MIYFYNNKKLNKEFAIDDEKQASHLHRDKKFNEKYEFLGASDGATFNRIIREASLGEGTAEEKFSGELNSEQKQQIWNNAFKAELEIAKQNPTPPRNFTKIDLGGVPIQNQLLSDSMDRMR